MNIYKKHSQKANGGNIKKSNTALKIKNTNKYCLTCYLQ